MYAVAQISVSQSHIVYFMHTIPADLKLAVRVSPGDTFEWSKVLLARANFNGTLELLTAAWERVLGYGRHEFDGKTLRQLMGCDQAAAADVVEAILDQGNMEPVDLSVRNRTGEARFLRLHRRLDEYGHRIMIVAEENPAPGVRAGRQTSRASGPHP
jgi:PAS domain-containing protein